ncbi:MAG: hypothetical protein U9R42_03285 [Bacteroidota bacterium]|nr:hypothetical protein [Bacteroidota bacterium]
MKKQIIFILFISIFLSSTSVFSQKIKTYQLVLPTVYFENGGSLYVSDLSNLGEDNSDFSTYFSSNIKKVLSNDKKGYQTGVKKYNNWYTTKFYDLADNKDADYLIEGKYKIVTNKSKAQTEMSATETSDASNKIPYVYYKYTASSNASINGVIHIKETKTGKIIKEIPINETKSDTKSNYLKSPSIKSPDRLLPSMKSKIVNNFSSLIAPQYKVITYKFPKLKTKDKGYKKELKTINKSIKVFADKGEITEMAKLYFKIQQKEDSQKVQECLGKCFEIIGNYTKAQEYYTASGSKKDLNRILDFIKVRNILTKMGITVNEINIEP